jgi:hypothetical protein
MVQEGDCREFSGVELLAELNPNCPILFPDGDFERAKVERKSFFCHGDWYSSS